MAADLHTHVTERFFRAMGSDAHIIVVGGSPGLIDIAIGRTEQLEQRWSRFLPDSDISRLNRCAGRPIEVSADTVLLIERSLAAWRLTGGAFDPTVLHDLVRTGYDRTFEALVQFPTTGAALAVPTSAGAALDVPTRRPRPQTGRLLLGCTDIEIDGSRVTLPAGLGFDAGGIGKGLAADLVVAEAIAAGAEGACVNLGGDLRVAGESPGRDGWTVAVEHPWSAAPVALLGMAAGAVATSTILRRTWRQDGARRHHLIDPFTGEPSDSDVTLATVVSGEAWHAEVLGKAILLRGAARAFDLINDLVDQALTVDRVGTVRTTAGLAAFLGEAPVPDRLNGPELEDGRR